MLPGLRHRGAETKSNRTGLDQAGGVGGATERCAAQAVREDEPGVVAAVEEWSEQEAEAAAGLVWQKGGCVPKATLESGL